MKVSYSQLSPMERATGSLHPAHDVAKLRARNTRLRAALDDLLVAVDFCGSAEFPADILNAARIAIQRTPEDA